MRHVFTGRRALLCCAAAAVLLSMGQTSSAATGRKAKHREDARTCERFGARYGTPEYSNCMLAQQRRRDEKQLRSLEESERLSQLAKDGQIMAERARRQRCDRNPDRRECGRR